MRKQVHLLISSFILGSTTFLHGQEGFVPPLDHIVQVPASPEAAAFASYGNTPVSQYTGIPGISIPLAQITGRGMSLPITLTYDASGIKVEQNATWVGLGWNLNVGGAVVRNINGLPDDYHDASPKYYPHYSTTSPSWGSGTMKSYVDYYRANDPAYNSGTHTEDQIDAYDDFLDDYNASMIDTQPDTYSFSAMGISGTIFIDYSNSTATCIEHPEYYVVPTLSVADSNNKNSRLLTKWTITDNFGNKYTFDKPDTTHLDDYKTDGSFRDYYSAWNLSKFESTNGRDVVEFVYSSTATGWTSEQQLGGTASYIVGANNLDGEYAPELTIYQPELLEVKINGKKRLMLNKSTTDREDLPGKKLLNNIEILDLDGTSQNVIDLKHSYFDDGDSGSPDYWYEKRLRLDGIDVLGASSQATGSDIKAYTFDYFGNGSMVSKISMAQDYWGYYNNQNSNTNLIPDNTTYGYTAGANRTPSIDHALEGSLKKITYSTGGTTEFFYQENYVNSEETGGFRVYKIVDKPDANSTAQARYFYYDQLKASDINNLSDNFFKNSQASSGVLRIPTDFVLTTSSEDYNGSNWVTGTSVTLLASNRYKHRSSIVGYATVTEVLFDGTENNGFTVYQFHNDGDASYTLSTTTEPLDGKLLSTEIFDSNMKPLQKKEMTYDVSSYTGVLGYFLYSSKYHEYDGVKTTSGSSYYVSYNKMTTNSLIEPYVTPCSGCMLPGPTNVYLSSQFNIQSRWVRMTSETTTQYADDDSLVTSVNYFYDSTPDHHEVVATETEDGQGALIRTEFTYPQDLASGSNIYAHMETANRLGQVVKTTTWKGGTSGIKLQEQETTFTGGSTTQRPDSVKYASNGGTLEARIIYDSYDSDGNPLSLTKDGVENIQYLWDMNKSLPTATITGIKPTVGGAPTSDGHAFAYTSFETSEKGNWTYTGAVSTETGGPSGKKHYNLDGGSLTRSSLDSDNIYILGFWAKGTGDVKIAQTLITTTTNVTKTVSSGWKYYQVELGRLDKVVISENSGANDIDIDEVRLFKKGALMTTYVYDAAGRVITQTGPNGIPIHYEYDMHGRLIRVKDHEHNIVRLMDYEYKNSTN